MDQQNKNKEVVDLSDAFENTGANTTSGQYGEGSSSGTPKITRLIMKCSGGLLKNEKHASYVLLVVVVFFLFISAKIFLSVSNTPIPTGEVEEDFYENPNLAPTVR